ncbi:hypothetical protein L7Q18_32985, partial [Achromobacter xylosoxidans]
GLRLSAPYVRLAQARWRQMPGENLQGTAAVASSGPEDHALAVQAELIDIRDVTWLPGFKHVALESRSDVRLTNGIASSGNTSALMTAGSMDVTAARLYPTTGAIGTLVAGASAQTVQTADYWTDPDAVLRIHGT